VSAITITAEERDALYDQILVGLTGIGDVWTAIEARNFEAAERLGRAYCDDLRLLLDDLGWGGGCGGPVELRTPANVLRRALARSPRCTNSGANAKPGNFSSPGER